MKLEYKLFENQYRTIKKSRKSWQSDLSLNFNRQSFRKLLSKLYFPCCGKLLELGCGDGENSLFFAKHGYTVYGIDISSTALDIAKRKFEKHKLKGQFILDDVIFMSTISSDYFDIIIDGSCFHCILNQNRHIFLKSVFRVLKKGGFCQFRTICGEMTNKQLKKYYNHKTRNLINLETNNFQFFHQGYHKDIMYEVENAGFTILQIELINREREGDCDFLIIDVTK